MSTQTFTWQIDGQPSGDVSLRVRTAKFGDGYEQVSRDGINNKVQTWPVMFTGQKARIQQITDFLDARGGAEAFYWTPPLGAQGLYRVTTYKPSHAGGDVYRLSATFQQTFQP